MLTAYGGVGALAAAPCVCKYQRMCSAYEIESKRIESRFGSDGSDSAPAKRKEEVEDGNVSKLGRALSVRAIVDCKKHHMCRDSSRPN